MGVSEESKAYRLYDPIAKKIVISRDVVFEDDKSWSWDMSNEEHVMADLEWANQGDNAGVNKENDEVISGEEEANIEDPVGCSQTGDNEEEPSSSRGRVKAPPVWMRDYVSGDGLSNEEDINASLALFVSTDPVHFDEVVKHENWRRAMDVDINCSNL